MRKVVWGQGMLGERSEDGHSVVLVVLACVAFRTEEQRPFVGGAPLPGCPCHRRPTITHPTPSSHRTRQPQPSGGDTAPPAAFVLGRVTVPISQRR